MMNRRLLADYGLQTAMLVIGFAVIGQAALAGVTIELMADAAVGEKYVRLGKVARIAGDREEVEKIDRVYLGRAPIKGEVRAISRLEIRRRLSEIGLYRNVTITGSQLVRVQWTSLQVKAIVPVNNTDIKKEQRQLADDLTGRAEKMLASRAIIKHLYRIFGRDNIEVDVVVHELSASIPLDVKNLKVMEKISGRLPGQATLVLVRHDPETGGIREVTAKVTVSASAEVVMLRRALRPRELIQANDIYLTRRRLETGKAYLPVEAKELAGRQAAKTLRAMTPLQVGDLEIPPVVVKNHFVTVKTIGRGFSIQSSAKALASGQIGDQIMVEDMSNKAQFPVRVAGPNQVEILVAGGK